MAKGVDDLVNHVLSEIALTGVQGAGSAEFKRFVQAFYEDSQSEDGSSSRLRPEQLGLTLYERIWHWVIGHADIRITHEGLTRQYTLAEFEAAEKSEPPPISTASAAPPAVPIVTVDQTPGPAKSLLALRDSMRQRLTKEGLSPQATNTKEPSYAQSSSTSQDLAIEGQTNVKISQQVVRAPRVFPSTTNDGETVFDDAPTNTAEPRLFASQNRIWQALTGHGIDLKKVPTMEFVLLSLIASHGAAGVTQPDLTVMSGQDKRSVPHRTDELCRKGYIEKRPVQSGKLRTSLCVHKKFVSDDHFLTSGKVEDVFQYKKFVLSGFVHLLYNTLKDAGIVPTRDIRKRLNVPMSTWNKRAVQGALIRLDQTGMVKRFRARRKDAEDNWLTCIEVLREPRPEDHENLKFRRQVTLDEAADEQSDEDVDGDTLMRDLEVDMLNSDSQEVHGGKEDAGRIPPQWIPERLLSNTLHEVIDMGGPEGWDAGVVRDRIVGKFWRRPIESYLTRLTDDWEATQPAHLRHLALIRDARNTQEKKFVHYVYRTYGNFQKAVDAGEVIWAGVSKPAPKQSSAAKGGRPKKDAPSEQKIDAWGFRILSSKDFVNKDGSGSLSECRAAIVLPRKYGPRWDNLLVDDIGYEKIITPKSERPKWKNDMSRSKINIRGALDLSSLETPRHESSPVTPSHENLINDSDTDSEGTAPVAAASVLGLPKRKHESGLLTVDQRIALGLKPKGRLSKFVEDQIREHRKRTGDTVSIPESIVLERPGANATSNLPKTGPLMTKEERIAAGLPPRGRLGQKIEDQIREQRGLPKSVEKVKKPRKNRPANEPALLSKEQRIKLGIIPHGRLPQSLMEGLREERDFDIPFEQSKVIPAYLSAVKDKKPKAELTKAIDEVRLQMRRQYDPTRGLDDTDDDTPVPNEHGEPTEVASRTKTPTVEKRKANDETSTSQAPKRLRVEQQAPVEGTGATIPTPPLTASAEMKEPLCERQEQDESITVNAEEEVVPVIASPPHQASGMTATPPRESSPIIDLAGVDAKVRLIKETYSSRSAPGVYLDPFAKRKIGQGRPRNAYIATFRVGSLTTLDWFKEEAKKTTTEEQQALARRSVTPLEREVDTEEQRVDTDEGDNTVALPTPAANVSTAPDTALSTSGGDNVSAARNDAIHTENSDVQPVSGLAQVHHDTATGAECIGDTSRQSSGETQTIQQHARPVAGWNAINKPLETVSTYQSPYATSDPAEPTPVQEPLTENDTAEQDTQADADESQIQGVCGPITEEDTISRSARKLAAYMGTKTGGGSQKMFRHKIIMQIIDLCDGVYPMHGEIGRPFTTLWKQQYPNLPPPNSSTVLSNLRDLIADPRNGLKKFSFLIRLRQSAGLKKKDMVVYQHLSPTSPQVTKLAYKMANYSNTKAHQYYPEEIRHLVSDESFYVPMPVAPKDETVSLERLNPSLQHKIKEANLERRRRYYHKQKNEETARDAQNAGVEAPLKKPTKVDGQPRVKRARLASLNDKNKRYRRAPLSAIPSDAADPELEESIAEEIEPAEDEPAQGQTLTWKEPWIAPVVRHDTMPAPPEAGLQVTAAPRDSLVEYYVSSITAPIVRFYATNGTFSTELGLVRATDLPGIPALVKAVDSTITQPKGKKRVRIVEPASQGLSKKARLATQRPAPAIAAKLAITSSEEIDDSYSSSTSSSSSDDEDDISLVQVSKAPAKAQARAKAKAKAKRRSKKDPLPTLLERLTGLTGDPSDPVYLPPKPRLQSQKTYQGWSERKKAHFNKQQRERRYAESQDPVDKFKKLVCTLIVASSMAGDEGRVDWSIVEKVHASKGFDLARTKALWAWMQTNMAPQIAELTIDFEARFLEAYENNRIATIEDPAAYDWANLVRWAMHTCVYPELSLPVYREALQQFIVELSSFEALDRPKWYRERIADRVRTHLQLQYPFTAPLHQSRAKRSAVNETELKARSWIRANTATPQALYDSKTAHEKLKSIGDPVLAKVVGEYVDRQMLRMRKLKRLLPGRNYTFTARLAKKYGRIFELSDFMAAVKIKKDMDAAFAQGDPEKRIYSISRAEPDGAIMAVMSLLGDGKVSFAPQLPPVNSEFGAPLPRLSVWGFMEADYVHRGIDRRRLFWDIHVVPTDTFDYGNPLQPASTTLGETTNDFATWSPLPDPPLPGKHDSNALLPIWSSMDGQKVTWPWWYRILNLVLQPLIFQPGATVEDIHANCDEYTTEVFEIQLVLQWLESVNAVKKTVGGGYVTLPGVWAAFGDVLHDLKDDWLNAHVKRKHKKHEKQQWRDKYHLRYSTLPGRDVQRSPSDSEESDMQTDTERKGTHRTGANIMRHPNEQYAIVKEQIAATAPEPFASGSTADIVEQTAEPAGTPGVGASETQTFGVDAAEHKDVEMQNAHGTDDVDAEGEVEV